MSDPKSDQQNNVQLSQGYEVLAPKGDKAYPIPCSDWEFIKSQISKLNDNPWILQNLGSIFLGASIATFVSIILGAIPIVDGSSARPVAWTITIGTFVCGALCYWCASREGSMKKSHSTDITAHMELIASRYGDSQDPAGPDEPALPLDLGASSEMEELIAPKKRSRKFNPYMATTLGDMVTAEQLRTIRMFSEYEWLNVDEVCLMNFGCEIEELSKAAANSLISILKRRVARP